MASACWRVWNCHKSRALDLHLSEVAESVLWWPLLHSHCSLITPWFYKKLNCRLPVVHKSINCHYVQFWLYVRTPVLLPQSERFSLWPARCFLIVMAHLNSLISLPQHFMRFTSSFPQSVTFSLFDMWETSLMIFMQHSFARFPTWIHLLPVYSMF